MEPEFWLERWRNNEIGFHQDQINPNLPNFWPTLVPETNVSVFVPLCGKSADMDWLHERGHRVFGVDISPIAIKAFFDERKLAPQITSQGRLTCYEALHFTLWCGDFFALERAHLTGVSAVYDRASLVALPPALRFRYSEHMTQLLALGTEVLLISLDYPPEQMQGPPFAINAMEIHALYDDAFDVRELAMHNTLDDNPRFRERGLTRFEEHVYALRRK